MGRQGQWDPALFTKILYWTHTRTSARWPTTVQRTAAPRARGGASSARFIRANYSSQLSKSGLVSGAAPWLKCCTNAPPPFFRAAAGFRPGRSESSSVLPPAARTTKQTRIPLTQVRRPSQRRRSACPAIFVGVRKAEMEAHDRQRCGWAARKAAARICRRHSYAVPWHRTRAEALRVLIDIWRAKIPFPGPAPCACRLSLSFRGTVDAVCQWVKVK